jgi:threonine dehydratase
MESTVNETRMDFAAAQQRLKKVVKRTPLILNAGLSKKYQCKVYLKREDLQVVRSYKLRGAYNMMSSLPAEQLQQGVVCASAGNHAQGFAFSCKKLNVKGVVFMPIITPKQKVNQTKMFGDDKIEIKLVGDTFDDCAVAARQFTEENKMTFIPPFDDLRIIEGQGTDWKFWKTSPKWIICSCRWVVADSVPAWDLISKPFHPGQKLSGSNRKALLLCLKP